MNNSSSFFKMKLLMVMIGLLATCTVEAKNSKCDMLEYKILRRMQISETGVYRQLYQACLDRPNRAQDPIRKSRCMMELRTNRFPGAAGSNDRVVINIESFRQDCE